MEAKRPELKMNTRPPIKMDQKIIDAIKGTAGEGQNYFGFDPAKVPLDMEYEGKRYTIMGAEDRKHQASVKRTGWAFVPADRHPECPTDDPSNKIILNGGLALMERHTEYCRLARDLADKEASGQIQGHMDHLKISDVDSMPRQVQKFNRTISQEVD